MHYQRHIKERLVELLQDFRIVYLTGPRQAGKSTLAKDIAREFGFAYYTLDDTALLASARNDPHGLLASLPRPLVLDEFQYVPELTHAVKRISDNAGQQKGLFLLTGSSDIFRSARIQEGLPGHMARVELHPLSLSERLGTHANPLDQLCRGEIPAGSYQPLHRQALADILLLGGFPEVLAKSPRSRSHWFASYLEGRLLKDFELMHQGKGDYHSKLAALVRSLAGLSGNLLKYASVAGDLSLDDKTVKRYMEVLELMFIIRRIHPYFRNSAKQGVVGMSKLHFLDTGLACHLLGMKESEPLHLSHFFGGLAETLVCGELFKHATWSNDQLKIHHYRDTRKNEIDLVIERGDGKVIGIEVKASMTVGPKDFAGLSAFAEYADSHFLGGFLYYSGETVLPFRLRGRLFHALPLSSLWMH